MEPVVLRPKMRTAAIYMAMCAVIVLASAVCVFKAVPTHDLLTEIVGCAGLFMFGTFTAMLAHRFFGETFLELDDDGLTYQMASKTYRIPWSDIDSISVAWVAFHASQVLVHRKILGSLNDERRKPFYRRSPLTNLELLAQPQFIIHIAFVGVKAAELESLMLERLERSQAKATNSQPPLTT